MHGPVERAIRYWITEGEILYTPDPTKAVPFKVRTIDGKGILLLLGKKETPTKISWECLEGIPAFLRSKGWVKIEMTFNTKGTPNTFDGYMKKHIRRATANYIAVVLEKANIVEIDRRRPLRIRLKPSL